MKIGYICGTCVYAPSFCGNEPENCVDWLMRHGGADNGERKSGTQPQEVEAWNKRYSQC